MAQRDAAVRLQLQAGAFAGGLRDVARQTQRVGQQMGRALAEPMKAGFKAGRNAAGALMNDLKGALKAASTLGGAIGVGAGIKSALEMRSVYSDLAFQISKTGKESMTWQQIQSKIEPVSLRTSRSTEEMAAAFKTVFGATGDSKYAAASLEAIANTANATGYSVEALANTAQIMQRKFGASTKDMPEMLARFIEKLDVGGAGIADLGPKFDMMAGEAASAGFKGAEGLSQILGVMVSLDSRMGPKGASGLKIMMERFRSGSASLKKLEKDAGFKFEVDSTAFEKLRSMLSGKGRAAAELNITGDARPIFDELARPFDEAMEKAKASGATTEEATKVGLDAFDRAMADAGKSSLTAAKVAEEAARRQEEPQRKMRQAMETFYQAFTKPEMLSAMDDMAKSLPKLAEGLAKIVEFVTRNPALAGGMYVGGRVGGAAVSGFAGNAVTTLSKKSAKGIGDMIAKDVASSGAWATAGKAVGVAAAALIAYEIGKSEIDKQLNKDQDLLSRLKIATEHARTVAGDDRASPEMKKKALEELRAAKVAKEKAGTSVLGAAAGGVAAFITGDKSLDPAERGATARADAGQMINVLSGQLGNAGDDAKRAAMAFKVMGEEARAAANELRKVKGGGSSGGNGLPPSPPNEPGAG